MSERRRDRCAVDGPLEPGLSVGHDPLRSLSSAHERLWHFSLQSTESLLCTLGDILEQLWRIVLHVRHRFLGVVGERSEDPRGVYA